MKRPVGASSTDVTISANDRLGNASFRSGVTSVMFMPGILGNVPAGSPVPTGGGGGLAGATGTPRAPGGGPGQGGGTSIGGVSAGGLNGLAAPNGVSPGGFGSDVVPGSRLGGAGSTAGPAPGSCIRAWIMSPRTGIIRSPYGLSLGRRPTI